MGGCQPIMKEQPVSSKKEMGDNIFNKIMNSEGNGANNVPWQHNDTQDEKLRKVREELLGSIRKLDSSISQINNDILKLQNNYESLYGVVENEIKASVEDFEIDLTSKEMKISKLNEYITSIQNNVKSLFDANSLISEKINKLDEKSKQYEFVRKKSGKQNAVLGCISINTVVTRLKQYNVSVELTSVRFFGTYFVKKGFLKSIVNPVNHHYDYELIDCTGNPMHINPNCKKENHPGLFGEFVIEEEYVIKELIPYFVKLQKHMDSFNDIGAIE